MKREATRGIAVFCIAAMLSVLLYCACQLWPESVFALLAPGNDSVWELSKIALWPPLLAALAVHIRKSSRGSLGAYLMVPAALPVALLFVLWFLRMVCGICSGAVDLAAALMLLAVGDAVAFSLREATFLRRILPMIAAILLIWIGLYIPSAGAHDVRTGGDGCFWETRRIRQENPSTSCFCWDGGVCAEPWLRFGECALW